MSKKIEVKVPATGTSATVEVEDHHKVRDVIELVVDYLKLQPASYWLQKGEKRIRPDGTIGSANIMGGDVVELIPDPVGGGFPTSTKEKKIEVKVPATGASVTVEVEDHHKARDVMELVVDYLKLQPASYWLQKGIEQISPDDTIGSANIMDGDVVEMDGDVVERIPDPARGDFPAVTKINLAGTLKYGALLKYFLGSSVSGHLRISNNSLKMLKTLEEREEISYQKRIAIFFSFGAYAILIVSTIIIIFLEGFHRYGFDIDDGLLKWLGITILGEVAGLAGLVYGSLFK